MSAPSLTNLAGRRPRRHHLRGRHKNPHFLKVVVASGTHFLKVVWVLGRISLRSCGYVAGMTTRIRPIERDDALSLGALRLQQDREVGRPTRPGFLTEYADALEDFDGCRGWLAEEPDGRPVGSLLNRGCRKLPTLASPGRPEWWYVQQVFVSTDSSRGHRPPARARGGGGGGRRTGPLRAAQLQRRRAPARRDRLRRPDGAVAGPCPRP